MNFLKKWTIDLAKVPSYVEWKGDWKYPTDRELIRCILDCEEIDEFGEPIINDTMKTRFKNNIVDKIRNRVLWIEWSARKGGLGRRYSAQDPEDKDTFSSAGNLGVHARVIKNTIFHYQGWLDYDMIKGHPSILLSVAKNSHLTGGLPAIERFVNHFDDICEELIQHYSLDKNNLLVKDDIKFLHNRTIYGGGHKQFVEDIETGDVKRNYPAKPCNPIKHPKYIALKKRLRPSDK